MRSIYFGVHSGMNLEQVFSNTVTCVDTEMTHWLWEQVSFNHQ